MNSAKKPLWLVFENEDELGEDIIIIFKNGDGKWMLTEDCVQFLLLL